jgi:transposase InsO family protein
MIGKKEKEAIIELYFEAGVSARKFVVMLDNPCSINTLENWLRDDPRYEFRSNRPQYVSDEIKAEAVDLFLKGIPAKDIAQDLNLRNHYLVKSWAVKLRPKEVKKMFDSGEKKFDEAGKWLEAHRDELSSMKVDELIKLIDKLEFEKDFSDAESAVLKKLLGSVLMNKLDISNEYKFIIISFLGRKISVTKLCEMFDLPRSTYYFLRNKEVRPDKYEGYEEQVLDAISIPRAEWKTPADAHRAYNYGVQMMGIRGIRPLLIGKGVPIHERQLRIILKKNGLNMEQRKKNKKHNSGGVPGGITPPNYLYSEETGQHYFSPANPFEILVTDVTEFHYGKNKTFLSVILDLNTYRVVSYRIGSSPDSELIVGTLRGLIDKLPADVRLLLHSDQGTIYRTRIWAEVCDAAHILQSISRRGKSCDNAACEGFFGRLKQQWFNGVDYSKFSVAEFEAALHKYIAWYNSRKPSELEQILLDMNEGKLQLEMAA